MKCLKPNYISRTGGEHEYIPGKPTGIPKDIAKEALQNKEKTLEQIPCGKCEACKHNQKRIGTGRLIAELRTSKKEECGFITLTYNEEHVPKTKLGHYTLQTEHMKQFKEKLKKVAPEAKYFLTGHYGENAHRPHYHGIIYNGPIERSKLRVKPTLSKSKKPRYWYTTLTNMGNKGDAEISGPISNGSCGYVAGHETLEANLKDRIYKDQEVPFHIQSPGLGKEYYQKHHQSIDKHDQLILGNGKGRVDKYQLPTYYKALLEKRDEDKYHEQVVIRGEQAIKKGKDTKATEQAAIELRQIKKNATLKASKKGH